MAIRRPTASKWQVAAPVSRRGGLRAACCVLRAAACCVRRWAGLRCGRLGTFAAAPGVRVRAVPQFAHAGPDQEATSCCSVVCADGVPAEGWPCCW